MDGIDREIMFKEGFPPPTDRTKRSSQGFEAWKFWVKIQEDKKRNADPNKPAVKEKWEVMIVPGYKILWDYKTKNHIVYEHQYTGELIPQDKIVTNQAPPSQGRRSS